jgi:hypothetical protein
MSGPSTRSTGSAGQARARTSRTAAAVFSPRTFSSARYPVWATFPHQPANERLDQKRPTLTRLTPASASSATRILGPISKKLTGFEATAETTKLLRKGRSTGKHVGGVLSPNSTLSTMPNSEQERVTISSQNNILPVTLGIIWRRILRAIWHSRVPWGNNPNKTSTAAVSTKSLRL